MLWFQSQSTQQAFCKQGAPEKSENAEWGGAGATAGSWPEQLSSSACPQALLCCSATGQRALPLKPPNDGHKMYQEKKKSLAVPQALGFWQAGNCCRMPNAAGDPVRFPRLLLAGSPSGLILSADNRAAHPTWYQIPPLLGDKRIWNVLNLPVSSL